jgi:hypothetical protein
MRLSVASILLVGLFTTACQNGAVPVDHSTPLADPASASPQAQSSPTPPPADPVTTADVCAIAGNGTQATTQIFIAQMATIEEAAAHNDQAAVVAAAAAINAQFQGLAATLTELAKRQITPELRTALTDVATALTQLAAPSYTGTSVDILKKLADFAAAFDAACAPPATASVTVSPAA